MSPISAAIVNASTHPIPGTVSNSGTYGWLAPPALSSRLISAIRRSRSSISSRLASIVERHGCGTSKRSSSSRPATPNRSVTGQGVPEGDHRRVDAALQAGLVLDQVHPEARLLTLAPHPG